MVGVYIGIAVCGVIQLMVFVDQLPDYLRQQESKGKLKDEIKTLLFATFKHLRHVEQLLLIPLTIYSGLEQGFLGAEFYKVSLLVVRRESPLGLLLDICPKMLGGGRDL